MASEYDPLPPRSPLRSGASDLDRVRARFTSAAAGYLRTPWSWWAWSVILPAVALATRPIAAIGGPLAVLLAWSVAILVGGVVEGLLIVRGRDSRERSPLAGWVLSGQGNLSLVGLALSVLLLWRDLGGYLPALWLLLVGHSFFTVGGLSFKPLRTAGLILQAAGALSLLPALDTLVVFAVGVFMACVWTGWSVRAAPAQLGAGG